MSPSGVPGEAELGRGAPPPASQGTWASLGLPRDASWEQEPSIWPEGLGEDATGSLLKVTGTAPGEWEEWGAQPRVWQQGQQGACWLLSKVLQAAPPSAVSTSCGSPDTDPGTTKRHHQEGVNGLQRTPKLSTDQLGAK